MFKLPEEVKNGVKDFKSSLEDFISGKINSARFAGIRVPWGTYSHRGGKIFMSRIRITAGQISPKQLKAIAFAARAYGNGIIHLTTRQDIQIHAVKLEDTVKVIEYLNTYDLSPRGGGGNTVRNITACPLSGICKDEVFEVNDYAAALTEYLLRQDTSFNMPRKLKISFSGCAHDCCGCLVNDVGLVAEQRNKEKGFKVFAGGGMGAEPILGAMLEDFIPESDLGYCVQAIKNIFYKKGDRKNKHHNRLRFLIKDIGFTDFKKIYEEEFSFLRSNEYIVLRKIEPAPAVTVKAEIPSVADEGFLGFLEYSAVSQKQDGLSSVELRIPRGDLSADNLEVLADLEKSFPGIEFRTSLGQNILICNINKNDLYKLFLKIKDSLRDFLYAQTLLDVVCCKGALTCNLGLCNTPSLTEEVEKVIKDNFIGKSVFKKLNIKINGCPNACGQHPIGLIALHGMVRKVDNRPVPFYKLLLGGRKAFTDTRLALDTGILIPAKNVPVFLNDFINQININIDDNTDIYRYIDEKAIKLARETAGKYSYVPAYSENKDFYIDWGRSEEFSLDGLGPGECGKGVLDVIDADLADADKYLESAGQNHYLPEDLKKILFFSARALLIVKGIDPKTEEEALSNFIDKFIKQGMAGRRFSGLMEFYSGLKVPLTEEQRKEKFLYIKEFFAHIKELYKNMDPALNFPKYDEPVSVKEDTEKKENLVLNLQGVRCPLNYVQAKLFLENIEAGRVIELYLDEGEPVQNVPVSLKNDGQEILEIKKIDGYYKVRVRKLV